MGSPLEHSSSRKLLIRGNKIVKFYPSFYGYLFHELFRILFQILSGVYRVDFISVKRRLLNEAYGRKVLGSMKINSTKLAILSIDRYFLEEFTEHNSVSIHELERTNVTLADEYARKIGSITRKLNTMGYYFIDNRSSNWLVSNGKIVRTDLELFRHEASCKTFYAKCDYLSFLSSVDSDIIKQSFIGGYGKKVGYFRVTEFMARTYIKIMNMIF